MHCRLWSDYSISVLNLTFLNMSAQFHQRAAIVYPLRELLVLLLLHLAGSNPSRTTLYKLDLPTHNTVLLDGNVLKILRRHQTRVHWEASAWECIMHLRYPPMPWSRVSADLPDAS